MPRLGDAMTSKDQLYELVNKWLFLSPDRQTRHMEWSREFLHDAVCMIEAAIRETQSADEPPVDHVLELLSSVDDHLANARWEAGGTARKRLRKACELLRAAQPPASAPRFQVGEEVFAGCAVRKVLAISHCYKLSNTICEGSGWTMFDEHSVEPYSGTTKEGEHG